MRSGGDDSQHAVGGEGDEGGKTIDGGNANDMEGRDEVDQIEDQDQDAPAVSEDVADADADDDDRGNADVDADQDDGGEAEQLDDSGEAEQLEEAADAEHGDGERYSSTLKLILIHTN